ncbi:MAG: hypothetical protein ABSG01_09910 [Anaerolineales bacterium]|jgi:hypothetical protein
MLKFLRRLEQSRSGVGGVSEGLAVPGFQGDFRWLWRAVNYRLEEA